MITPKICPPMKILLAVDGSEHSIAAAQFIRDLPLSQGSEVIALGVLSQRHTPSRYFLLAALDKAQTILQDSGAEVRTGLLHGNPAEALTDFADEHKPDLMVVGAKGLRATLGILLGGVAQQVVEYAPSPVLVVRAPYHGLRRVLAVTDGSAHSRHAVQYLGKFPFPETVDVRLIHVLPPLTAPVIIEPYFGGRDAYLPMRAPDEEAAINAQQEREGNALLNR